MRVRFRLLGALRVAGGSVSVEVAEGASLGSALERLTEEHPALSDALRRPSGNLILVNGVEAGNLRGGDTPLGDDAEVVVIPVTHGG